MTCKNQNNSTNYTGYAQLPNVYRGDTYLPPVAFYIKQLIDGIKTKLVVERAEATIYDKNNVLVDTMLVGIAEDGLITLMGLSNLETQDMEPGEYSIRVVCSDDAKTNTRTAMMFTFRVL